MKRPLWKSYNTLTWGLTVLFLISMLPRLLIPPPDFQLFAGEPRLGFPITGIIGLLLLPGIAFSIGRGKAIPSLLCYIVLQGTMRRFLITDSGLPRGLVFWDDFLVFFLLFLIVSKLRIRNVSKTVRIVTYSLFGSCIIAFISLLVNNDPVLNVVLGMFRSVFENPLWLIALLLVDISRRERSRLFFELCTVLLFCHLGASIISAIIYRGFLPGDPYMGVYGWSGSNFLSITASIVLFFVLTYPSYEKEEHKQFDGNGFYLARNARLLLALGWGFLLIFGASRLGILLTVLLGLLYWSIGIFKRLLRFRLNSKKFTVFSFLMMLLITAVALRSQRKDIGELDAIGGAFRSPAQWLQEWNVSTTTDVTRGVMLLHNIDLLNQDSKRWLLGVGAGMYRSSTGSMLRAPLVEEAERHFGGRWCAPMYLSDSLVEYGLIGLFFIIFIPLGTIVIILRKREYAHFGKKAYFFAVLLMLITLAAQSTIEHRGVMIMLYFIGSIIFTAKTNKDTNKVLIA